MISDDDIDSFLRAVAAAPPPRLSPDRSLVGEKIGNYTVTRLLGMGGMGAVYVARHPLIGKQVAVKVLHDETTHSDEVVARFFQEAKAVNDIHHENIVDIIDFGQAEDQGGRRRSYILMELLEGESLRARLGRGIPPLDVALHILEQAASALGATHARKIVHRDIKPDNIFLTAHHYDACFVKLLDFGIVKLASDDSPWKTRTGALIGTPLYMSPEQCAGHGRIDSRSDIYSLGLVMFELLTGRGPFPGTSVGDLFRAHLNEFPPPPSALAPAIPAALDTISLRCLEKNPAARFASMDELLAALRGSRSPPFAVAAATQSSFSRRRALLLTLLAGVALAGTSGMVVTMRATKRAGVASGRGVEPDDATIQVRFDSSPTGAVVRRAGVLMGRTPVQVRLKKGRARFEVQLELDGWKTESRTISPDYDQDVVVAFRRPDDLAPPTTQPIGPKRLRSPSRAQPQRSEEKIDTRELDDSLL